MGLFGDIARGLNVFGSSKKKDPVKVAKGAMTFSEYQKALGLYAQIKQLKKTKESSERRLKSYAGVQLAKSQRPERIDEMLKQDYLHPTYRRLVNKWRNTSPATKKKFKEITGGGSPPWETGDSLL